MTRTENIDFIINELMRMNGTRRPPETHLLQEKQRLMRALINLWQPQPLSAEFLQAQDRELQAQAKDKGIVRCEMLDRFTVRSETEDYISQNLTSNSETVSQRSSLTSNSDSDLLSVWQGDITRLQVDAIVNAANSQMLGCFQPLHGCIDNAIHSAAGLQLRQECWEIMSNRKPQVGTPAYQAKTSEVIMTRGYNLPARYVLHTVGPIVPNGCPTPTQRQQLSDCYTNCLDKAADAGLHSIAFCCISTGVFGYPQAEAAEVAVETVKQWLTSNSDSALKIIFCTFKDYDTQLYQRLLHG